MILYINFSEDADKRRLYAYLKLLKPKTYQLDIKVYNKNRSVSQNSYYWGCVLEIISRDTGEVNKDRLHNLFKWKFSPRIEIKIAPKTQMSELFDQDTGEVFGEPQTVNELVPMDTSEMNTIEFEEYLENIRVFMATEYGITIPLPDKNYKINQLKQSNESTTDNH